MLRFIFPLGLRAGACLLPTLILLLPAPVVGSPDADSGSLAGAARPDSVVLGYLKSRVGEDLLYASDQRDSMLLRRLGLDWPIRPWNMRSGQGVLVARSPTERYFILIGVGYGEFGPGGDCHYCLLDSLGHRVWTRDGRLLDLPQVSDTGEVVLFEIGDRDRCGQSLTVRWLASGGLVTGEHTFEPLISRFNQRSCSAEIQILDEATRRVYFTINEQPASGQPTSDTLGKVNNVRLVAMDPAGVVEWTYPLGGMGANAISMALGGRRLVIDDLGEASVSFANVLIVLTSEGHLVRRIVLEKNLGCYQPVVERNDHHLLFVDGELRRMDTKTGDVLSVNAPDWLEEQALEWKADSRPRLAKLRLDQLDRLSAEIAREEDTDWPAYFRRWGHREGR